MKIYNLLSNIVELVVEGSDISEAMAALSLNRTIKWVKFTLTDDQANANSQRIPKEEFANLIKTGLYMPIKMARGYIREGHEFSVPMGVITNLVEREHTVEGIAALLAPDGVFVFEVSYLVDVFEKTLFDTVYHEHLAYHSVAPLVRFFAAHGLELFAAERVASHGGSLRGFAQLQGGPRAPVGAHINTRAGIRPRAADGSVAALVQLEKSLGLDKAATLAAFGRKIDAVRDSLRALLLGLKQTGKRIAGFGAPAKATTLMYHFGLGPDVIEFIADDSPLKQGLFTPGLHVPVLAPEAIYQRRPDYLLILAWNFAQPIMTKHARFAAEGGRFIVPLPTVEVHPP